jgi:hypothetical protein
MEQARDAAAEDMVFPCARDDVAANPLRSRRIYIG